MTDHLFRVLLVVPVTRKAGLDSFIKEEFDATGEDWLLVPLSADGQEPISHYMTCFSCTMPQTSAWANRLTSDGGVPLPPEFPYYSADQRIAFMTAAGPTLKQLTGVVVHVCRNDGEWFDVPALLQAEGLQTLQAAEIV